MSVDIIGRIDRQLAAGEPRTGFDFGDPQYPKCPHCGRHWHGLRLTRRVATMYACGRYDDEYDPSADDTPVLCEGSGFIGPQRAEKGAVLWSGHALLQHRVLDTAYLGITVTMQPFMQQFAERMQGLAEIMQQFSERWTLPEPDLPPCPPDLTVEYGPRNWHYELQTPLPQFPTLYPRADPLSRHVHAMWPQFTQHSYPTPPRPGLDFSRYQPAEHYGPKRRPLDGRHH